MTPLAYPRLAAMIYHIVASLRHVEGRTRLMKLIYLSDIEAVARLGHPISGARFYSYTHGPFAKEVLETLREMRGFWIEETCDQINNAGECCYTYSISRFPHEPLEIEDADARAIVNEIVDYWGERPLRELLDYVYDNEPFKSTPVGQDITFDASALTA